MKKRKGSAIMMVIIVLTLLLITTTYLMRNKTQRAGFTRHMSNEKKLEVLMEAVLDMCIANIKKHANDHDNAPASAKEINDLLRSAGTSPTGIHSNGGKNAIISVSDTPKKLSSSFYDVAINSITAGDPGEFKIGKVEAKIVHAEAFGDSDYEVAGITVEPSRQSAYYFPDDNADPSKDWRVPFHYPPHEKGGDFRDIWNEEEQPKNAINDYAYQSPDIGVKLKYKGLGGLMDLGVSALLDDEVTVNLLLKHAQSDIQSDTAFEFGIHLDENFVEKVNDLIDFANTWLGKDIDPISDESITESVAKAMGEEAKLDIEELILDKVEQFSEFKKEKALSTRALQKIVMGTNTAPYMANSSSKYNFNSNIVEKGALLQLTCEGEYTPNAAKSPIERTLIAEIPVKVTDVQPMASDYTFFVANSKLLSGSNDEFPKELDFNKSDGGSNSFLAVENELTLHNMAHDGPNSLPSNKVTSYNKVKGTPPIAGRIRVNGTKIEPVHTFMGGIDSLESSQLSALALTNQVKDNRELNFKLTFAWTDTKKPSLSAMAKNAYIHFPVLTTEEFEVRPAQGLDGLAEIFSETGNIKDIFTMPTLFYGYGHMDYPYGNRIEGNVPANLAELHVIVLANYTLTFDVDIFNKDEMVTPSKTPWHQPLEIYYGSNLISEYPKSGKQIPYGLPNVSSYADLNKNFTGNYYKDLPTNCYSDIQYRKKASRFYSTIGALEADCGLSVDKGGLKNPDGSISIDGVIYVDVTTLDFGSFGSSSVFKGNGLIVSNNIKISNDVVLADKDSSLGIIARTGILDIEDSNVSASCYSNGSPEIRGSTIFGNLIVNEFNRETVYDSHIRYTPDNITVKGTTFPDDGSKENERRYYASFADNWSNSYFEKK